MDVNKASLININSLQGLFTSLFKKLIPAKCFMQWFNKSDHIFAIDHEECDQTLDYKLRERLLRLNYRYYDKN